MNNIINDKKKENDNFYNTINSSDIKLLNEILNDFNNKIKSNFDIDYFKLELKLSNGTSISYEKQGGICNDFV